MRIAEQNEDDEKVTQHTHTVRERTVILISWKQSFAEFNFRSNRRQTGEFYLNIGVTIENKNEKKVMMTMMQRQIIANDIKDKHSKRKKMREKKHQMYKSTIEIAVWTASYGIETYIWSDTQEN